MFKILHLPTGRFTHALSYSTEEEIFATRESCVEYLARHRFHVVYEELGKVSIYSSKDSETIDNLNFFEIVEV